MPEPCTFLQAGELAAIVGDDTPRGLGGQQYSGLWSLVHHTCPASVFQSAYAGIINGAHRGTGPTLEPIDRTSARLVRTPCDRMPYGSVTGTYRLVEPHYIDYQCEVTFNSDATDLPPVVPMSWCCYMSSPLDSSIHFIENNVWTTLTPVTHGEAATVFPAGLDDAHRLGWERRTGEARFAEQDGFHASFSGKTFDHPFYFGVIHGMTFLIMADHHRDFRFFISPSGGGYSAAPGRTSPAWDFAWNIWDPKPGETRTLNLRVALFRHHEHQLNRAVWDKWEAFREQYPTR